MAADNDLTPTNGSDQGPADRSEYDLLKAWTEGVDLNAVFSEMDRKAERIAYERYIDAVTNAKYVAVDALDRFEAIPVDYYYNGQNLSRPKGERKTRAIQHSSIDSGDHRWRALLIETPADEILLVVNTFERVPAEDPLEPDHDMFTSEVFYFKDDVLGGIERIEIIEDREKAISGEFGPYILEANVDVVSVVSQGLLFKPGLRPDRLPTQDLMRLSARAARAEEVLSGFANYTADLPIIP